MADTSAVVSSLGWLCDPSPGQSWPLLLAVWTGVAPSLIAASTSAPCAIRSSTWP